MLFIIHVYLHSNYVINYDNLSMYLLQLWLSFYVRISYFLIINNHLFGNNYISYYLLLIWNNTYILLEMFLFYHRFNTKKKLMEVLNLKTPMVMQLSSNKWTITTDYVETFFNRLNVKSKIDFLKFITIKKCTYLFPVRCLFFWRSQSYAFSCWQVGNVICFISIHK